MTAGLRAFLRGLIDYAGLFPPELLSLEPAMQNYARYAGEADNWMLGRFIIPAGRLPELDAFEDLFSEQLQFRFSVLGHPALKMDVFDAARATVSDVRAFEHRRRGAAVGDLLEMKVQPDRLELSAMEDYLALLDTLFSGELSEPTRAFFEVPLLGVGWTSGVEKTVRAIADFNGGREKKVFGLKLRCGGVTADAFPEPEAVTTALLICRDAEIPFKATAGLHHPVRHYSESVETMMHGFLNVFGGAILARVHGFDSSTLERMLSDEHAPHFNFSDDGFRWMEWSASTEEIAEARETFGISYGSCSFDEPREDLAGLGFMEAPSLTG